VKNLTLLMILMISLSVHVKAQNVSSSVILKFIVENSLKEFELEVPKQDGNIRIEGLPNGLHGFKAIISADSGLTISEWVITWKAAPVDSFIEQKGSLLKVKNNLRFNLAANPRVVRDTLVVLEKRRLSQLLKATIIPGGSRFHNDSKVLGFLVGTLEVAPVPLWFYFNDRREFYLNKAIDAAKIGNREELNRNYDKSQKFRRNRDLTGAVFVGSFLFNLVDTILNVKTRVGLRPSDLRKQGLKLRFENINGMTVVHFEKAL